jgi:hypothetical protein
MFEYFTSHQKPLLGKLIFTKNEVYDTKLVNFTFPPIHNLLCYPKQK